MAAVGRGLKLGLLALSGVLAVGALAWVASNWSDDPPSPEPEALRLPPASPGSALFFKLQGVQAPAGESPEAAGRQAWAALHAASASSPAADSKPALFQGGPLGCSAPEDCQKVLSESPERLEQQLRPLAALGERCQQALADPRYEEPRAPALTLQTPLPSYLGAVNCAKWFRGQALVAAHAGDAAQALAQFKHSRQLLDALLVGTESLIGKMVAAAIARGHLEALAAAAVLRPAWSADLQPLAAPWPAGALDARRWIATERAFATGSIKTAFTSCEGFTDEGRDRLFWLACKTGIGWLPNATLRALDGFWLEQAQRAQQGLQVVLDQALVDAQKPRAEFHLAWRNTLGMLLVDVARPGWATYYARQADMDLQRQAVALLLAVQAQQVPLAERNAWLDRQGLAPQVRARLNFEDGGASLQSKPWQAELPGTDPRRNPWRLRAAV